MPPGSLPIYGTANRRSTCNLATWQRGGYSATKAEDSDNSAQQALGVPQVFAVEASAVVAQQAAPVGAVASQHAALSQPAQPQASQTQSPPEQQAQAASQLPQTQAWDKAVGSATAERNAKPAAATSMTTANRAVRAFNMIFLSRERHDRNRIKTPPKWRTMAPTRSRGRCRGERTKPSARFNSANGRAGHSNPALRERECPMRLNSEKERHQVAERGNRSQSRIECPSEANPPR